MIVDATRDGVAEARPLDEHRRHFSRIVDNPRLAVGHNLPQEAPAEFAAAVVRLR